MGRRGASLYLCAGLQSSGSTLISWCFLQRRDMDGMLDADNDLLPQIDPAIGRPLVWYKTTLSCFRLSELDLELRGPGAIYGTMQHGELDLRVAKLTDTKLVSRARAMAAEFIDKHEKLLQYKHLNKRVNALRAVTSLN